MSERKSFIIHKDSLCVLDELSDEECGRLFRAIKAYQLDETYNTDRTTGLVFAPFRNQFDRDNEKYVKTCEIRAEAGAKGGKQKVANAIKSKQKVANLADSKSNSKSDSKNKNVNDSNLPPTESELIMFAVEHANTFKRDEVVAVEQARLAYRYYSDKSWLDAKGEKIVNWKSMLLSGFLLLEKLPPRKLNTRSAIPI